MQDPDEKQRIKVLVRMRSACALRRVQNPAYSGEPTRASALVYKLESKL